MTRTLRAVAVAFLLLAVISPSLVFLPPFRAPIEAKDTPIPAGDAWRTAPGRPAGQGGDHTFFFPIIGNGPVPGSGGDPGDGGGDDDGSGPGSGPIDPIDGQPPAPTAAVTDLAAVSAFGVVGLTWSAPMGDGPLGGPTAYDLRYATAPITEGSWDQAQAVDDPPYPAAPRGKEAFSIEDLTQGQTYHLAVRAVSASGALGPISNDAAVTVNGASGNMVDNGSFEGRRQ